MTEQRRTPSAAIVVAVLALVAALAGTAVAEQATTSKLTTKKVKKIAKKQAKQQVEKLAPGLSVANADNATNADSATNADNATNADQLGGASLDSLTIGRGTASTASGGTGSSCDPASTTFVDCGTASLTLPRAERVLILANAQFDGANSGAGYRGDCKLTIDGTRIGGQVSAGSSDGLGVGFNGNNEAATGLNAVTDVLAVGPHSFALQCNQAGGSIQFGHTYVSALAIGAG
jgi:hypothetical protein